MKRLELWSKLTPKREKELGYAHWERGRWTFSKTMYTADHAFYELRRVSNLYPDRIHILKEVDTDTVVENDLPPWMDDDIGDMLYNKNRAEG